MRAPAPPPRRRWGCGRRRWFGAVLLTILAVSAAPAHGGSEEDSVVVEIAADAESVTEGEDATFTLTRTASDVSSTLTVEVAILIRDDGALVHNRAEGREVTFSADAETASLTFATTDDSRDEPAGEVRAVLIPSRHYSQGPAASRLGITAVLDNDPPTVSLAATAASVTEGASAIFRLTRTTGELASTLTVQVTVTEDGDVISGTAPTEVTFRANRSTAFLTVATDDDDTDESDGAVHAAIAADDAYLAGAAASGSVPVLDNDLPSVTITADRSSVAEGEDATFTLTRTAGDTSSTLKVEVVVLQKDNGAGYYNGVTGQLVVFDAGATTASMTVATDDDEVDEPAGELRADVIPHRDRSYLPGSPRFAIVEVRDDDEQVVTVTADSGSVEEGAGAVFTLARTAGHLPSPLTVQVSVAEDGDVIFGSAPTTARFVAGSSTATLTVATDSDSSHEPDGRVRITVDDGAGYRVGAPASASVAVLDNDRPFVWVTYSRDSVNEPEGNAVTTIYPRVQRRGDLSQPLAVQLRRVFTTTDRGQTRILKTETHQMLFAADRPAPVVSWGVRIENDDVWIQDHRVTVSIDDSNDYQTSTDSNSVSIRIVDNDQSRKQVVRFSNEGDLEVTEGDGAISITLRRGFDDEDSTAALPALTVNLSVNRATPSSHHVPSGLAGTLPTSVRFGAGKTTTDVTLRIADDAIQEDTDTFRVTLRPGKGYVVEDDVSVEVEIEDDDHYEHWARIETAQESVTEGEHVVFTITRFLVPAPADARQACQRSTGSLRRLPISRASGNLVNFTLTATGNYLSDNPEDLGYYVLPGRRSGVTFAPGQERISARLPTHEDIYDEVDGSFELRLWQRTTGDFLSTLCVDDGYGRAGPVAILDDDDVIGLTLSVSPSAVREGDGARTLTVTAAVKGSPLYEPVEVRLSTLPLDTSEAAALPSASAGDFSVSAIPSAHLRGNFFGTATLTLTPEDDSLVEGPELLRVAGTTTTKLPNTEIPVPIEGTTLTIRDNEATPSPIALSLNPGEVTEDGGEQTVTVTATLPNQLRVVNDLALPLEVTGGTATGADYAATGVTVTIPANAASGTATLTVTPVDDNRIEGDETVEVTSDGGPYLGWNLSVTSATLTIADDDMEDPALTLERPAVSGFYHAGDQITVEYAVLNSGNVATAAPVVVHDTKFGQLTCSAAALPVPPETDTGTDAHRCTATATYTVADADVTAGEIVSTAYAAAGTVESERVEGTIPRLAPPVLRFDPAEVEVREDAGKVEFTVKLRGTTPAAATTVNWRTLDWPGEGQKALAGEDYTASSGTLTFANGATEQRIRVPLIDGYWDETKERFVVTLSEPSWPAVLDQDPVSTSFPAVVGGTAWILDDDRPAILETNGGHADEGDGFVEFWVTLETTGRNVTLDWATEEITEGVRKATAGSDFTAASGTLTFEPSVQFQDQAVQIAILEDTIAEPTERFRVVFSNAKHARIQPGGERRRGLIFDNDQVGVQVSPDRVEIPEGNSATYEVRLATEPTADVTVTATVPSGTDVTVGSANALTEELTFTSGNWDTSQTLTVHAAADDDTADDEVTVTHAASGGDYGNVSAPGLTVTVIEPPVISVGHATAREDAGTLTFRVSRSHSRNDPVTVAWATEDSTAIAGADYEAATGTLTFAAGELERTIGVTILDDFLDEADETFTFTLSDAGNARLAGGGETLAVRGAITDDDTTPSLSIAAPHGALGEDDASAEFEVRLDAPSPREVTVDWTTRDGTATAGQDYEAASGTLTFPVGEQLQTVVVNFLDDDLDEPDMEEFEVVLTGPAFAEIAAGQDRATQEIADDDDPPTLSLADRNLEEANADMTFAATLDAPSSLEVTADYATEDGTASSGRGRDYRKTSGTLRFPPGETRRPVPVPILEDALDEVDETFVVTLTNVRNAVLPGRAEKLDAEGTIRDDDAPELSAKGETVTEDTASAVFTVSLSVPNSREVTVAYATWDGTATAGEDYAAVQGTLTFAADSRAAHTIAVPVINDNLDEDGSEEFSLVLSAPRNAVLAPGSSARGVDGASFPASIEDDDDPPELDIDSESAAEDDGSMVFTVGVTGSTDRPITVDYATSDGTATAIADYTAITGALTIPPQTGSGEVTVTLSDDELHEGNETFTVTLSGAENATLAGGEATRTATGTIEDDDDAPGLTLAVFPTSLEEDAGETDLIVAATLTGGTTLAEDLVLPLTFGAGTATLSADFTLSAATTRTITIAAGRPGAATSGLKLTPVDDAIDEGDGETVGIGTSHGDYGAASATLTLADNDDPAVTVEYGAASYTATEGGDAAAVVVSLSADPKRTVVVPITKSNQGDAADGDYSGVPGNVTFTSGETSRTFTVTATDDNADDDGESVRLGFGTLPDRVSAGTQATATVTLADDDDPAVTVEFGAAGYTATEGGDAAAVVVSLSADPERTVTIPITKANEGGAANGDYTGVPASVTFTSEMTSQTFTVAATDDSSDDDGESVALGFGDLPDRVTKGSQDTATVTLGDNDETPSAIALSVNPNSVTENGGAKAVTVTAELSGSVTRTVATEVTVGVGDTGTATSGTDYTAVSNFTVTIGANQSSGTGSFTLTPTDDSAYEGDETIGVAGSATDFAVTGAEITLEDNEGTPVTVQYGAASYTAAEGGNVAVVVELSADPERTVTIPITAKEKGGAASGDYGGVPASVTFTSGVTSRTFTVTATQDTEDDDGESVELGFGNTLPGGVSTGTTTAATVNLTDDDDPEVTLRFGAASYTATEGGSAAAVVVSLSADPERTVTIPITKSNQGGASNGDYTGVPESVTFTSGEQTKTFTVTAADDSVDDDGESVDLAFGDLPDRVTKGSQATATVNLADDDQTPNAITLSVNPSSVAENGGAKAVTVTAELSGSVTRTVATEVTVGVGDTGTATSGTDYTAVSNFTVTIAANTSSGTGSFTLTPTDDSTYEGDETIGVAGTAAGFTVTGAGITLEDNEGTPVTVQYGAGSHTVAEGESVEVVVKLSAAAGRQVVVPITKTNQGGASDGDYSGVPENLTFGSGDTAKTFTVSATDDSADDDGESVDLGFRSLPGGVTAGTTSTATVNLADDDDPAVTVQFGAPSYTATEGGTAASVVVTLSADPERTVTIPINKSNEGGASNGDYTGVPGSVTFTRGEQAKTFTVTAADDSVDDDGESVDLAFGDLPDRVTKGSQATTTVNLADDDQTPNAITLSVNPSAVAENVATAPAVAVTATLSGSVTLADATRVTVAVGGTGTATSGTDYAAVSNFTVTIGANTSSGTGSFTLTPTDDSAYEGDETIGVAGTAAGFTVTGAEITLEDSEGTPVTVQYGAASYTAAEGGTAASVVVELSAAPGRTLTIPISKSNRDNASDGDYSGVPSNLTFAATDTSKTFTVVATDDSADDDGESVDLGFGNTLPGGVTAGTRKTATVNLGDDDDPAVTVEFGSASYTATEGGSGAAVVVELSADPERTVTVPITKSNQDGAEDGDYSGVPGNVTFTSGQTSTTFTVAATDDRSDDDGESVDLGFGSLPDRVTKGSQGTATVNLADDDGTPNAITLAVAPNSVAEDVATAPAVTVTATLSGSVTLTEATEVTVSVGGGTATSGTDYTAVSNFTVTIAANTSSGSGSFTLTPTDDGSYEGDETIVVSGTATGFTVSSATITLTDDEGTPVTVQYGAGSYTAAEGGTAASVVVELSAAPGRTLTIPISKSEEDGASSGDYSGVPSNLTFGSGDTSKTFTVVATDDSADDDGESVDLGFGTLPGGVTKGTQATTTVNLDDDDDPAVTVQFGAASYTATEGGSTAAVVVEMSADPERTVTVPITKTNQGGAGNGDYSGVPASVTFTNGVTSQTFTVGATDDNVDDDGESVALGFGSLPDRVTKGSRATATVTLADDDTSSTAITLSVNPTTVTENGGAKAVTVTAALGGSVTRTEATEVTVTVGGSGTATSGTDYTAVSNLTVTIAANTLSGTGSFTLTPTNDNAYEGDETIGVGGSATGFTVSTATINLTDDEGTAVTVQYGAGSYTAAEGGTAASVVVELSAAPGRQVVVPIEKTNRDGASDGDTSGVPSNLTFGTGDTAKTFTVTATQDTEDDDGESVDLGFGSLPGGVTAGTTSTATVNLTDDDDPAVTVQFGAASYTATEGGTAASVVVTLSADPERTVTVPITKTNQGGAVDGDHSGVPGNVTFTSGETSRTFTVAATDDSSDDDGESVGLGFGSLPTGVTEGTQKATTVNLADNDGTPNAITLSVNPSAVTENGGAKGVTVTAALGGSVTRTVATEVTVAVGGTGTATSGTDYTAVSNFTVTIGANTSSGSGSFTLTPTDDSAYEGDETIEVTGTASGFSITGTTITLTDDEGTAVTAQYGAASYTVAEGGNVAVAVTLSVAPGRQVVVPIEKTNRGGASDGDTSGVPSHLTFGSGDTAKTFTVTATQDTEDDDDESVDLSFGTLPGGVSAGTRKSATVNLTDDDDPAVTVEFGSASYTATEGGTAASVVVSLSADPERTVTVPITKTNQGGAVNGDYTGVPASVTFTSGVTSQTFTVGATDDNVDDDGESVDLGFGSLPDRVTKGSRATATVTLADNDATPNAITLSVNPTTVTENGGAKAVAVTAALGGSVTRAVATQVTVEVGGKGTATSGTDYAAVSSFMVTIAANTLSGTGSFTLTPTDDSAYEGDETIGVAGTAAGFTVTDAEITLTDNEGTAVTVQYGAASYTAAEGGSSASVVVTLSAAPGRQVVVPIEKTNQGGASDGDYSGVPSNLTFGSGDTAKTFTVTATQDTEDDDDESVELLFGTLPGGVSEGTRKTATVNLTDDDDPAVTVEFGSASYNAAEGESVEVVVELSADPERTVTVPITKSNQDGAVDGDYTGVPASVTFTSGVTSTTFTVTATQDTEDDDDESVELSFGHLPAGVSTGTTTVATVNLVDDDDPAVEVEYGAASYTATEGGSAAVVVVGLSAAPERQVVVLITKSNQGNAANGDYSGVPENLTFRSADTSKTFTVAATDDNVDDDGESVELGFGALPDGVSEGSQATATVNLGDNDGTPTAITLAVDPDSVAEDAAATPVTVTATLDGSATRIAATEVTVSVGGGTAISGTDYAAVPNFTVTIAANTASGSGTFTLHPNDDRSYEGDETIGAAGTAADFGFTDATITLTDDETAPTAITLAVDPESVGEDASATPVTVTATLDGSATRTTATEVTVSVGDSGTATPDTDYTAVSNFTVTIAANTSSGSGTFTLDPTNDSVYEGDETIGVAGTATDFSFTDATITLADDETAPDTITLTAAPDSVAEDDPATLVTVTAKLEGSATRIEATEVTVSVGDSGTATPDTDYIAVSNFTVTIAANTASGSGTFTLTPLGDTEPEGAETIEVKGEAADFTVTGDEITLIEASLVRRAVQVSYGAASYTATEGGNAAAVVVELSADAEREVVVPITASNQNGAAEEDYSGVPENLTFGSGATSKTFTVTATDDSFDDDDESVALGFGTLPDGVTEGGQNTATVNLVDDDGPTTTARLAVSPKSVPEDGGPKAVTVTATLDGPVLGTDAVLTVSVSGENAPPDFVAVPSFSLTILAQSPSGTGTFTLDPVDDGASEGDETVTVSGTAGDLEVVPDTLTITDDDESKPAPSVPEPEVTIGDARADEGSGALEFPLRLDRPAPHEVLVDWGTYPGTAEAGTDYSESYQPVRFAPGATGATLRVTIVDDSLDETDETFDVQLFGATGATVAAGTATGTIVDDDGPEVSIGDARAAESEGFVTFEVSLSAASPQPVNVSWATSDQTATAGLDYRERSGTMRFHPGSVTRTIRVPLLDDSLDEPDETFLVTPDRVENGTAGGPGTGTIVDDDAAPLLTIGDGRAVESDGALVLRATLSAASGREITVLCASADGTATSGADYVAAVETLIFPPGVVEMPVRIELLDDSVDEYDETLDVVLSEPENVVLEDPVGLGTIEDDDAAPALTIGDARARESDGQIVFPLSLDAASGRHVEAAWVTVPGTAEADLDYRSARGTVVFEPGSTSESVRVEILNDLLDETEESFEVRLEAVEHSTAAVTAATGTIEDDDDTAEMAKAWLSRFGRTVSTQVVTAVGERLTTRSGTASSMNLGLQRVFGASGQRWSEIYGYELGDRSAATYGLEGVDSFDLLTRSSFVLSLDDGDEGAAGRWTAWGRGDVMGFSGAEGLAAVDAQVVTGLFGLDYARGRLLAGVVLTHSVGDGNFTQQAGPRTSDRTGVLRGSLSGVTPYLRLELNDRFQVWGLAGRGHGDMDLDRGLAESDLTMSLGAVGARGTVLGAGAGGGLELAVETDAFLTRLDLDGTVSDREVEAEVSRARLRLEASRSTQLPGGTVVTPSLEVGTRYDGGDAETGAGLEIGSGLQVQSPGGGLTVDLSGRLLVVHQDSEYREWGIGGAVRLAPGPSGRGPSLNLTAGQGAPSNGIGQLWQPQAAVLGGGDVGPAPAERRLDAEMGYGVAALWGTVLTPYGGLAMQGLDSRALRFGTRLNLDTSFNVALEATRQHHLDGAAAYGLTLRGSLLWGTPAGAMTPRGLGSGWSGNAISGRHGENPAKRR